VSIFRLASDAGAAATGLKTLHFQLKYQLPKVRASAFRRGCMEGNFLNGLCYRAATERRRCFSLPTLSIMISIATGGCGASNG
jgi:hypothetical protein